MLMLTAKTKTISPCLNVVPRPPIKYVRVGKHTSSTIAINTGAPQGCVLSPLLYTLFTHDCFASSSSNLIVKFAGDTTVLGLITNNNEVDYRSEVQHLLSWCHNNNLVQNTNKTKEIIVDFCKNIQLNHQPLSIGAEVVERVTSFKFLGVTVTEDLSWGLHTALPPSQAQQRLYYLRKLKSANISRPMMMNFYNCAISSVLTYGFLVWYFNCTKADQQALQRVVKTAGKIKCSELPAVQNAFVLDQYKQDEYQKGHVIYFCCDPGYTTGLNTTYMCTERGWTEMTFGPGRQLPCASGLHSTSPLTNGYLLRNSTLVYSSGQKAEYRCGQSFMMRGGFFKTCTNGQWTGDIQCHSLSCSDPQIANANYSKITFVNHNQKLRIRCNHGYEDKKQNALALCQHGNWVRLPVCEKIDSWCGPPPQIPNAIIKQVYQDMFPENTQVEYVCETGFELTNNDVMPPVYMDSGSFFLHVLLHSPQYQTQTTTINLCLPQSTIATAYPIKVRCVNGRWTKLPTCEVDFCKLDTSQHRKLENIGDVFIKSGTKVRLSCSNIFSAYAVCSDNQLSLSNWHLRLHPTTVVDEGRKPLVL
ncbi:hypothetical protein WMY93_000558 [Mugilogobius chulae]|uniref:Uncharacterized protein n=1 Tax=Mugilogobius chulae TaxID=88201 RepID=A0AAW0QAE2_9GOBI